VAKSANLVQEESTTTGTGNFTLSNKDGRQSFNGAFGTGGTDLFYYFIMHQSAAEWEVGTGHMSDATTLVRDTVINSTNSNAAVSFSAGTKDVTSAYPASYLPTVTISDTTPSNPENGDLWFDSTDGTLNLYYTDGTPDNQWVSVSTDGPNVLDEDDFASNSAAAVPTQQSAKAYADAKVPTPDEQTFSSSGTWTKPSGSYRWVLIEVWGGGGGGDDGVDGASSGGGGGGGAYNQLSIDIDDLSSTETVTIGAGGSAGSAGGTTNFGGLIYAYGGGQGGTATGNGSGGGGASPNTQGAAGTNGVGPVATTDYMGGAGGDGGGTDGGAGINYGGGGGGGGATGTGGDGGAACLGGAGGAGGSDTNTTVGVGGVSIYGGNGGDGGAAGGASTAGSVPGGGGGGGSDNAGNASAGGAGYCIVTCY